MVIIVTMVVLPAQLSENRLHGVEGLHPALILGRACPGGAHRDKFHDAVHARGYDVQGSVVRHPHEAHLSGHVPNEAGV
eukprot:scaffold137450_cov72-Phaeocystis_antarctica.AAC.1